MAEILKPDVQCRCKWSVQFLDETNRNVTKKAVFDTWAVGLGQSYRMQCSVDIDQKQDSKPNGVWMTEMAVTSQFQFVQTLQREGKIEATLTARDKWKYDSLF